MLHRVLYLFSLLSWKDIINRCLVWHERKNRNALSLFKNDGSWPQRLAVTSLFFKCVDNLILQWTPSFRIDVKLSSQKKQIESALINLVKRKIK